MKRALVAAISVSWPTGKTPGGEERPRAGREDPGRGGKTPGGEGIPRAGREDPGRGGKLSQGNNGYVQRMSQSVHNKAIVLGHTV